MDVKIPWIEKYRPTNIENIIVDETNKKRIDYIVKNKVMPNMIIVGEPGIGKTTTILCLAKLLLGDQYKQGVLELNASDKRGIKIVQESITTFCKKKLDCHKIILLDEADNLTSKAQQLIATLMETYEKTTRFAFTCNNSNDIMDSIQSRCTILRYRRLGSEHIKERILQICDIENVDYTDKGLDYIIKISDGDLRSSINYLQTVHIGFGKITVKNIEKICDKPNVKIMENIIDDCLGKKFNDAIIKMKQLKKGGYSGRDIIIELNNVLKGYENIDNHTRIKYIEQLGKTCMKINKGIDTNLQLYGCVARMCAIRV